MNALHLSLSLGVTAEALRVIIGSKLAISHQRGPVDPKFQVEGVAPTNHSSSLKTRLNDLSYDIQVAQLSQRDRAAGWVSNGQKLSLIHI